MIELGSEGSEVRCWQRIVGAKADGKFGPATAAEVQAWQSARGVDPDGVIGPLTRAALAPGDLIKPYEGLRLWTYDDKGGVRLTLDGSRQWRRPDGSLCIGYPTIGWGRRLWTTPDKRPTADSEAVTTCTREEADRWFAARLANTDLPAVRRAGVTEPGQVAACASFAYNCGPGALAKIAKAKFDRAAWLAYKRTLGVVNAGLLARREEEFALFSG